MSKRSIELERILIGHPDESVRQALAGALRGLGNGSTPVYTSSSIPEALEKVSRIDPHIVFLDLGTSPGLARDAAASIRKSGRFILGVYNPLLTRGRETELIRAAARAGVDDFVSVPIVEADVHAALLAGPVSATGQGSAREGMTMSFFSARGGVGTTTLAMQTALALADNGGPEEVVFCDADLQFGTAAHFLGLTPDRDLGDLADEIDEAGPLQSYLTRAPSSGLSLLPRPGDLARAAQLTPDDLSRVLITLRRRFAHVVVDLPPCLNLMTLSVLDLSECIFLVVDPFYPSLVETGRLITLLGNQGFSPERLRLVVNQPVPFPGAIPVSVIEEELHCPVHCAVPNDPKVRSAAHAGEVLSAGRAKAPFSKSILQLVSTVRQLTATPAG